MKNDVKNDMKNENAKSSVSPEGRRYLTSCSAQEMTGLIPAGPIGEEELENYEELYPFLPKAAEAGR